MKTLFQLVFLSIIVAGCGSSIQSSFSGVSTQNPVLIELRRKFDAASVPTNEELQFEKTWACRHVSAKGGYDYMYKDALKFSPFGSLISQSVELVDFSRRVAIWIPRTLIRTNKGIEGKSEGMGLLVRVTREGNIIAERSELLSESERIDGRVAAIGSTYSLESFWYCLRSDVH